MRRFLCAGLLLLVAAAGRADAYFSWEWVPNAPLDLVGVSDRGDLWLHVSPPGMAKLVVARVTVPMPGQQRPAVVDVPLLNGYGAANLPYLSAGNYYDATVTLTDATGAPFWTPQHARFAVGDMNLCGLAPSFTPDEECAARHRPAPRWSTPPRVDSVVALKDHSPYGDRIVHLAFGAGYDGYRARVVLRRDGDAAWTGFVVPANGWATICTTVDLGPAPLTADVTLVDALGRWSPTHVLAAPPIRQSGDPDDAELSWSTRLALFGALPFLVAFLGVSIVRRRRR